MFTHGNIDTFKELMNEFFYDWRMTPNPQVNTEPDGYWVNKTSLFIRDGEFFLTYKTTSYAVSAAVFSQFKDFYDNLYSHDQDFEVALDYIENEWNSNELTKVADGFLIGGLKVQLKDFKYYLINSTQNVEITKRTFQKINRFYDLLNPVPA